MRAGQLPVNLVLVIVPLAVAVIGTVAALAKNEIITTTEAHER